MAETPSIEWYQLASDNPSDVVLADFHYTGRMCLSNLNSFVNIFALCHFNYYLSHPEQISFCLAVLGRIRNREIKTAVDFLIGVFSNIEKYQSDAKLIIEECIPAYSQIVIGLSSNSPLSKDPIPSTELLSQLAKAFNMHILIWIHSPDSLVCRAYLLEEEAPIAHLECFGESMAYLSIEESDGVATGSKAEILRVFQGYIQEQVYSVPSMQMVSPESTPIVPILQSPPPNSAPELITCQLSIMQMMVAMQFQGENRSQEIADSLTYAESLATQLHLDVSPYQLLRANFTKPTVVHTWENCQFFETSLRTLPCRHRFCGAHFEEKVGKLKTGFKCPYGCLEPVASVQEVVKEKPVATQKPRAKVESAIKEASDKTRNSVPKAETPVQSPNRKSLGPGAVKVCIVCARADELYLDSECKGCVVCFHCAAKSQSCPQCKRPYTPVELSRISLIAS